jgi:hypothetical protein
MKSQEDSYFQWFFSLGPKNIGMNIPIIRKIGEPTFLCRKNNLPNNLFFQGNK